MGQPRVLLVLLLLASPVLADGVDEVLHDMTTCRLAMYHEGETPANGDPDREQAYHAGIKACMQGKSPVHARPHDG